MGVAQSSPILRLHESDNVAVAKERIPNGTQLEIPGLQTVETRERIDFGHKVALVPIESGAAILKYGETIGYASSAIQPGESVHVHNVVLGERTRNCEFATEVSELVRNDEPRTFMGYRRSDGRAATRNYIGLISTVNCSATTAKYVAQGLQQSLLDEFPNIDGIVPLSHKGGCAFEYDGPDHRQLARTMAGFARHPNIAASLILGLGCETSQGSYLADNHNLVQLDIPGADRTAPLVMNIQDYGGVARTVARAIEVLKDMLPHVNDVQREPIPVSEIILGTECGGSDANSGVTANPAVGIASDLLIALGGTSILAEVPEMYGAEHMLTRRATSPEVGKKLLERIRWWEEYSAKFGVVIDNNPSVGNKKGGLTTIFEKSLGAIAKGGHAPLRAVYEYAEPVTERGLVIMDTPGFDPASVTGMVAGGANMIVFTTGRGSCFGCKPVPTIKVATNTPMYERMEPDMDINAGRILEGASVAEVGEEILEKIVSVASGEQTKSEQQGIGDEEFCPWVPGPVL